MKRVVSKLESKGLIEKVQRKFGKHQEQGITYRVLTLSRQPAVSQPIVDYNKEEIKKINKGRELSLDTKDCPDCDGMGVRYIDPLDYSKGTVKCRHERLGK
jgi:hypothetical protein